MRDFHKERMQLEAIGNNGSLYEWNFCTEWGRLLTTNEIMVNRVDCNN